MEAILLQVVFQTFTVVKKIFKRVMMGLSVCIEDAHTQINLVCHLASPTYVASIF